MTQHKDEAAEKTQRTATAYETPRLVSYGPLETLTMAGSGMDTETMMGMMMP